MIARNLAVMVSGAVLAQVVTMAALPLLGRLYTPSSFGELAAVMAVASLSSSVVHGRYQMAIPVAKDADDPARLLLLSSLLSLLLCLPISGAVALWLAKDHDGMGLAAYLGACAGVTLLTAMGDILTYWRSHRGRFRANARNSLLRAVLTVVAQAAFYPFHQLGILIGAVAGLAGSVLFAGAELLGEDRAKVAAVSARDIPGTLVKYRDYPIYGAPQGWLAALSWNLLPLLLLRFGGVEVAGQFWVAFRLIVAPLALFNNMYRQVVLSAFGKVGPARSLRMARRHTLLIGAAALLPAVGLALFGQWLLGQFMGQEWRPAGLMTGLLSASVVGDLVKVPSICLLQSRHEQSRLLAWEAGLLLVRGALTYALLSQGALHGAILAFSLTGLIGWTAFTLTVLLGTARRAADEEPR